MVLMESAVLLSMGTGTIIILILGTLIYTKMLKRKLRRFVLRFERIKEILD